MAEKRKLNKSKIVNWHNYQFTDDCAEKDCGISDTIPDQVVDIREMIQKQAGGILIDPPYRNAYYDDDPDFDDPDYHQAGNLDLVDRDNLLQEQLDKDIETVQKKKRKETKKPEAEEREPEDKKAPDKKTSDTDEDSSLKEKNQTGK